VRRGELQCRTKVLLASGAAVAISALKVRDKVAAASTKTGKTTHPPATTCSGT
jgi:hypothetical protein